MKNVVGAAGSSDSRSTGDGPDLQRQVADVTAIRLMGAPRTLLLDTWALLNPEGALPVTLAQKLHALSARGIDIVVLSHEPDAAAEALRSVPGARVERSADSAALHAPVVAILADPLPLPGDVFAWHVGSGDAGPLHHTTRHVGARATDKILALLGTAMVQVRAGAAFRAAGESRPVPEQVPFDGAILEGVARAVASPAVDVALSSSEVDGSPDLGRDAEAIVEQAFLPLRAMQGPSGAIAAAPRPRGVDEPNYWFFWQRDAGQVAIALAALSKSSQPCAGTAAEMLRRYVDFICGLPHDAAISDLGVSRFTMDGQPVRSYGSPQNDGPAQTVLAMVAALGTSPEAFELCRPFLDYLAHYPLGPCFDPWEFAVGEIFFDYNLARRALRLGARLARGCDDPAAERYAARADEIERDLDLFASPADGYIRSGRNFLQPLLQGISHLDIGVIGSILTAYDVSDHVLNVEHPLVIGTIKALERASAERWPVNIAWQRDGRAGMGVARFPEDANDGLGATRGNPWTFATLWAAQYYLRSIQRLEYLGAQDTGGTSRAEFLERADGYLRFVLSHLSPSELTEQIDGRTGKPRGARQLAWAQASLIETLLLRGQIETSQLAEKA